MLTHKLSDDRQEQIPIVFLYPKDWNKQVVIWVTSDGKSSVAADDPVIERLMDEGACIIGVDLLYQGEFLIDDESITKTRKVENPRESAAYTFGYNHSLFARRVHDILTVTSYVKHHGLAPQEVIVVGLDEPSGPLVTAARAQARDAIDRAVIHTHGFRFGQVDDIHGVNFLPGGAKYFDLPGMLAVAAPERVFLAGEGALEETEDSVDAVIASAYGAAGAKDGLTIYKERTRGIKGHQQLMEAVVDWILP